ncbi:MAG: two-component system, CitB family, sensor kinase [Pseudonocardiales bacterium]|jgi:two-component system CitB family sensor kinase|nr:two-component system, CitB family, sensor kinase [Pseudonocardiales bacterium]MDT4951344.1 two-component system, CitB family, sensor kinase [Pseudonocardiales bacterium]
MWRLKTLASRILLAVLGILLATVVIGGVLDVQLTRRTFDTQYEGRAVAMANVVAQIPDVRAAVLAGDPTHLIQPLAHHVESASGASYVVVTNRAGIRFSHPNPTLIGRRLEEPVAVLDGRDHVGIDHGSLGRSANGKAPIFDKAGHVIGQVSVGIVETEVAGAVQQQIAAIALYSAIALGVGALVALFMTRALKRVTFGLEISEISSLLQDREAMLHGIREGVIGFDAKRRVTLINNEARRLMGVNGNVVGRSVDEIFPPGRLRDVLDGRGPSMDQSVLTDDSLLIVNRNPVIVAGRDVGSVVTLRDRTELESLVRELHAMTGLANALRAQEHEFTNRLHVIAGLIDLGEFDEASRFVTTVTQNELASAEDLRERIAPPVVAALLLAKLAVGAEREITVGVTSDSHLDVPDTDAANLMTVIGNLVDNALDAVAPQPEPRTVTVHLADDDEILIVVSDNGPGIPADVVDDIFIDGYSTKSPRGDSRRGLGLALVQRLVHRAGGTVTVTSVGGARFEVRLPLPDERKNARRKTLAEPRTR